MSVKLAESVNPNVKHISKLKDGQIARIVSWNTEGSSPYIGRIVQRYKDDLITIGSYNGHAWTNIYTWSNKFPECMVEVLANGTALIVENNE